MHAGKRKIGLKKMCLGFLWLRFNGILQMRNSGERAGRVNTASTENMNGPISKSRMNGVEENQLNL